MDFKQMFDTQLHTQSSYQYRSKNKKYTTGTELTVLFCNFGICKKNVENKTINLT